MIRALVEFLFVIVLAMVGRAILTSIFRGVSQASANAFQQTHEEAERRRSGQEPPREATSAGVLHKDPVCGTFVAESTEFKSVKGGRTFYFCSGECREEFKPVPR